MIGRPTFRRRAAIAALATIALCTAGSAPARTIEHVTYLLPAPETAIVFAPFLLAQKTGLYAKQGLDVRFVVIPGGMNVGAALARGEGDLGGAVGDTPMLLRAKGMPVRGVALLGHHSFLTLITRHGLALDASLKGREIDVPALKDTSFYALAAIVRAAALNPGDVKTEAGPADRLVDALGRGAIDGVVGTVDWGVRAERVGAQFDYRFLDAYYPALAQAILASDSTIASRPRVVRRFVRATLDAMRAMKGDPAKSASTYDAAAPGSGYSQAEIARIFSLLGERVYGASNGLGRFDPATMRAAAQADASLGLMPAGGDADPSYTNSFVPGGAR